MNMLKLIWEIKTTVTAVVFIGYDKIIQKIQIIFLLFQGKLYLIYQILSLY